MKAELHASGARSTNVNMHCSRITVHHDKPQRRSNPWGCMCGIVQVSKLHWGQHCVFVGQANGNNAMFEKFGN